MTTTVPAYVACTQLGSLLKQVTQRKARFVITKSGKPTAVAAKEYRAGRALSLQDYLKRRLTARRVG